jgi:hypothetical protein
MSKKSFAKEFAALSIMFGAAYVWLIIGSAIS